MTQAVASKRKRKPKRPQIGYRVLVSPPADPCDSRTFILLRTATAYAVSRASNVPPGTTLSITRLGDLRVIWDRFIGE
jgi:hypothetical protein